MAWHKFPFTNLHDINLDWIVGFCKDAKAKIEEFEDALVEFAQTGLKNPHKLIIKQGDAETEYDGSVEKTVNIVGGGEAGADLNLTVGGATTTYNGSEEKTVNVDTELNKKVSKSTNTTSSILYGHSKNTQQDLEYPLPLGVEFGGTGHSTAAAALEELGGQSVDNLVTEFSENPSDSKYPSEKLVADNVAELGEDIQNNSIAINQLSSVTNETITTESPTGIITTEYNIIAFKLIKRNKHCKLYVELNTGEELTTNFPKERTVLFTVSDAYKPQPTLSRRQFTAYVDANVARTGGGNAVACVMPMFFNGLSFTADLQYGIYGSDFTTGIPCIKICIDYFIG